MNSLSVSALNRVADGWSQIMWTISLQFCVLGLAVLVLHWSLNRASPHWRYWLWQILAIKLLLMPFWTATTSWTFADSPLESSNVEGSNVTTLESTRDPAIASIAVTGSNEIVPSAEPTLSEADERTVSSDQPPILERKEVSRRPVASRGDLPKSINADVARRGLEGITPVEASHSASSHKASGQKVLSRSHQPSERVAVMVPVGPPAGHQSFQQAETPVSAMAIVDSPASVQGQTPDSEAVTTTIPEAGLTWKVWLMLSWKLIVVWNGARILWQGNALSRLIGASEPAGETLVQRVHEAARRLGMTWVPAVRILDLSVSPFVCGLWKVRLVLPRELPESFAPEQLDLVLLHELAHVRRRDLIWGWIPEIGKILFFFHPIIHFVCHQIRFERELACDHLAMTASQRDAGTYARTLVRVVEQFSSAIPSNQSPVANSHA